MTTTPTFRFYVDGAEQCMERTPVRHGEKWPKRFDTRCHEALDRLLAAARPFVDSYGYQYLFVRYRITRDGETIVDSYAQRPFIGPIMREAVTVP